MSQRLEACLNLFSVRGFMFFLGVAGCVFFGAALVASFSSPDFVERTAKEIIRHRVEVTVREKIDSLDARFLRRSAEGLANSYAERAANARRRLLDREPARVAAVIAEMANLDCECRKTVETSLRDGLEWEIGSAAEAKARLTRFIRVKYMETAARLTREFRIFTGTNAVVFAVLLAVAVARRRAGLHLLPVALVLLASASVTGYLYVFKQDWLHTVLFGDYVGFAYVGYLALVFACFCDIAFNRGRVTGKLLNGVLHVLGSAMVVVPC